MEQGGAQEAIRYVGAIEDAETRRAVYAIAQKGFGNREWTGRSLDALIEVVSAGINDTLRQALQTEDGESARKLTDIANRLSYNLSADLADCWPGDDVPRERRHFEAGLRAAEDCIRWRRELGKPPDRRAMAYWAVGMHQMSLENLSEAVGAFETASRLASLSVLGTGKGEVKAGGDFGVVLYTGYLGIARSMLGDRGGRTQYEDACAAFEGTAARFDGEQKEDAAFGLEQLRLVARKYTPGSTVGQR